MPERSAALVIFTIGHSTRTLDEFARLLQRHAVRQLADVRTVPASRRYPQFGRDALDRALGARGIRYRHFPPLGGLRKPRRDSPNAGLHNESFRGYADYMQTPEFGEAVSALIDFASRAPTAVMCAEAVWWRCHRSLLSDALVAQGVRVRHILGAGEALPHHLNPLARRHDGTVSYPAPEGEGSAADTRTAR